MKKILALLSIFFFSLQALDSAPFIPLVVFSPLTFKQFEELENIFVTHGSLNLQRIEKIIPQIQNQLNQVSNDYNFTIERFRYLLKLNRDKDKPDISLFQYVLTQVELKKKENIKLDRSIIKIESLISYLDIVIKRMENFLARLDLISKVINRLEENGQFLDDLEFLNRYCFVIRDTKKDIVWYQRLFRPLDITINPIANE